MVASVPAFAQNWQPAAGRLMTSWSKLVSPSNALPDYPRPQFVRQNWQSLNGLWDYSVTEKDIQDAGKYSGSILVPYPIESALSGVMKAFLPSQRLWYHRTFTIPSTWSGQHVLMHFGAVDWDSTVLVNGKVLGSHQGGYDCFTYDITNALHSRGPQDVVVSVLDPTGDGWQLKGKQTLHPGGAAYTATSGIWQSVWMEPVPASHLESLHLIPDVAAGVLHVTIDARITPHPMSIRIAAIDGDATVSTVTAPIGAELTPDVTDQLVGWYKATSGLVSTVIDVPIKNAHLWSPEDPHLYNLSVAIVDKDGSVTDRVGSYFGMRSISLGHDTHNNTRLLLNGKPILLCGVLDQGFWPDGIYTAPTDDALRFDLETMRKLGLNADRKHIKIEPDRWYYWADRLGILVLQDMPSGDEGDPNTDEPTSPEAAAECESEMRTLIQQRWNHPAIICWIAYNEGWGQHDTVETSRWIKLLDPSRLVDEASGFPHHGSGDVVDVHGGIPPKSPTEISIDSETSGNGLAVPGHAWPGKPWSTGTYNPKTGGEGPTDNGLYPIDDASKIWYTRSVRGLYKDLWDNHDATGATGFFKVQITDVENETNGLMSYDRAVLKVDPNLVAAAAKGVGLPSNVTYILPTAAIKPIDWKYSTHQPSDNWFNPAFNDASWKVGQSAFGSGYSNIHTPWTDTPGDIWLRTNFNLTSIPKSLYVRMVHDEDAEIYINGVLAARDGGYISAYDDYPVSSEAIAALKQDDNTIAVHCHQTTGGQVIDVGLVQY